MIRPDNRQPAQVRQRREPRQIGHIHIEQALFIGLHFILHRAVEALDKRCRNNLRAGFNYDRRRADIVGVFELRTDIDHRNALAIDRDLKLRALGFVLPKQVALLVRIERNFRCV